MPEVPFHTVDDVLHTLRPLQGRKFTSTTLWTPAQVLEHCAQSVDGSLHGYPRVLPAVVRLTVGRLVVGRFLSKGQMRHNLTGPLPGGPVIPPETDLQAALAHLVRSVEAFAAHPGPLQPHVLFGVLPKEAYGRYHAMHMADHFRALTWE